MGEYIENPTKFVCFIVQIQFYARPSTTHYFPDTNIRLSLLLYAPGHTLIYYPSYHAARLP